MIVLGSQSGGRIDGNARPSMAYFFSFLFFFSFSYLGLLHLHMLLQLMDLLSHNAPRGMPPSDEN
jgi:hypothetical protein